MTSSGSFIIGVHTGSKFKKTIDNKTHKVNYGTVFYDDKGLIDIFGFETLEKFMQNIPQYQVKQQPYAPDLMYWKPRIREQDTQHINNLNKWSDFQKYLRTLIWHEHVSSI